MSKPSSVYELQAYFQHVQVVLQRVAATEAKPAASIVIVATAVAVVAQRRPRLLLIMLQLLAKSMNLLFSRCTVLLPKLLLLLLQQQAKIINVVNMTPTAESSTRYKPVRHSSISMLGQQGAAYSYVLAA
eukprot:TRINITY_DN29619_c0_g1_i1.p1 TRINITY_DN29619_c0_g1~~TRINITY_DN29619_c0_g1_i1.p1  ORF type:complete len:130 (+),score=23.44 TRINITY_DN29619_c0_g1_i1:54-443(+)